MLKNQRRRSILTKLAQNYAPLGAEGRMAAFKRRATSAKAYGAEVPTGDPPLPSPKKVQGALKEADTIRREQKHSSWKKSLSRPQRANLNKLWANRKSEGGMANFRSAYRQSLRPNRAVPSPPAVVAAPKNIKRPLAVPSAGKVEKIPSLFGPRASR